MLKCNIKIITPRLFNVFYHHVITFNTFSLSLILLFFILAVLKHKLSITKPKYFICSNLFWKTYSDILQTFNSIKLRITLDDDTTDSVVSIRTLISNNVIVDLFEPATVRGQNDVAFIFYSSGTTGMPKGVQLTHLGCILPTLTDE